MLTTVNVYDRLHALRAEEYGPRPLDYSIPDAYWRKRSIDYIIMMLWQSFALLFTYPSMWVKLPGVLAWEKRVAHCAALTLNGTPAPPAPRSARRSALTPASSCSPTRPSSGPSGP